MTLAQSGIVPEWLDRGADPCNDFFAYACGGFLKTAVIPEDRSSWGAIELVVEENERLLRQVLEQAASAPGDDPSRRAIGDYYAACVDEAAIERAGLTPIRPLLDAIAAVTDAKSAAAAITQLHASGVYPFFSVAPSQDFADATSVIASFDQAGLGLPDRDYYLKHDGNRQQVRTLYRAHLARMFALLGDAPAAAQTAADNTLRFERLLAQKQQDQVLRRDPHAVYHRIERAGLVRAAPGFPWDTYLASIGIPTVTAITVHDPKYYREVANLLSSIPPRSCATTCARSCSRRRRRPYPERWSTRTSRSLRRSPARRCCRRAGAAACSPWIATWASSSAKRTSRRASLATPSIVPRSSRERCSRRCSRSSRRCPG
jgi:putative endopeptidase